MAFASVSKSNKIFAVEPFKYCHKIINYNKKINKFNNIKIIKKVLSNKISSYKLDYSNNIGTSRSVAGASRPKAFANPLGVGTAKRAG
jgi:FkbM family methyltransferase